MSYNGSIKIDTVIDIAGAEQGVHKLNEVLNSIKTDMLEKSLKIVEESVKKLPLEYGKLTDSIKDTVSQSDNLTASKTKEVSVVLEVQESIVEATRSTVEATEAERVSESVKTMKVTTTEMETKVTDEATRAQAASNMNMTLGSAVMGLFTGATTAQTVATVAATTATAIFKTAINALFSPMALFSAAVALITAGVSLLAGHIKNSNPAYFEAGEAIKSCKEKNEDLKDSLKESADSFKTNNAAAEASGRYNQDLAGSVMDLAKEYDGSEASAGELDAKLKLLNSSCEGLNLTFDETTGELSKTNEEIEAYITASAAAGKKNVLADHMEDLSQQAQEVQAEIVKSELEIEKWYQQVESGEMTADEFEYLSEKMMKSMEALGQTADDISQEMSIYEGKYSEALADEKAAQETLLKEQEQSMRDYAAEHHYSYDEMREDMEKNGQTFDEWTAQNADRMAENKAAVEEYSSVWGVASEQVAAECENQGLTVDEWNTHMQDTMDNALDTILGTYETMTSGLSDLTSKIKEDDKTTWEEIQANQADTIEKTKTFSDLYAELVKAGVSESYLEAIGATGPESIPLLESMLATGTDAILDSQSEWEDAYEDVAKNPLMDALQLDGETAEALQQYIAGEAGVAGTLQDAIEGVNFNGLAQLIPEEMALGLTEATVFHEAGAEQMADTVEQMTEAAQSEESRAVGQQYAETVIGGFAETDFSAMPQAIVEALAAGTAEVTAAMSALGTDLSNTMTETSAGIKTIVVMMMSEIQSTITMSGAIIKASVDLLCRDIVQSNEDMKTKVTTIVTEMMTAMMTEITTRKESVKEAMTSVATAIIEALEKLPDDAKAKITGAMAGMKDAMEDNKSTLKAKAGEVAGSVKTGLDKMVADAGSVAVQAMNGIAAAMENSRRTLEQKARSIAEGIASTMRAALEVRSPSRVMIKIFDHVMDGIYIAMDHSEDKLLQKAEEIAEGIAEHLTGQPALVSELSAKIKTAVDSGSLPLNTAQLQSAFAGGQVVNNYNYSMDQTNISPTPLNESTITRNTSNMFRRARYQLP